MKTTTLKKIRAHKPCKERWKKLLRGLGKIRADDEPLPYGKILEICGLEDALWATRTEEDTQWLKELALVYARHVEHLMVDLSSLSPLDVTERYLSGRASLAEMKEATSKACMAARGAINAAVAADWAASPDARGVLPYAALDSAAYFGAEAIESSQFPIYGGSHSLAELRAPELEWQKQEFLRVVS